MSAVRNVSSRSLGRASPVGRAEWEKRVEIRTAEERDLPRVLEIYNHYIEHTFVTFDECLQTLEERRVWFSGFARSGPHRLLVAERAGIVAGYASSREFRPRTAYRRSVETSIYLAPESTGAGIGMALYDRLLEILESETDAHRAYGGIALPNAASVALHLRTGFVEVARFSEVGFKFDQYWDVVWFERAL